MQIYRDVDVDSSVLDGKRISVLGYGSQGRAQALCLRDSGVDVTVGVRRDGESWKAAQKDELRVTDIADAVKGADIVMMLLPDEVQGGVYKELVEPNLKPGAALEFAHGFAITFRTIVPPKDVDVIMVAPKGPGNMIRMIFEEGFGVPAIFSIHQDSTGKARDIVLALCKKMGFTRPGVFEESFRNECHTDLFGEQAVLCGGITELIKKAFEVLVEAGYPPEMAYFEVLHETKLVVDLINKGGLSYMWREVSNTAEYGGLTRRSRIVTEDSKEEMRKILKEIQDGTFSSQWISEFDSGMVNMRKMEKDEEGLLVEKVGKEIRREFFNRE